MSLHVNSFMQIGFFISCLSGELDDIFKWANAQGFEALEIGGMHGGFFRAEYADDINEIVSKYPIKMSALGCYANFMDPNEKNRNSLLQNLRDTIDAASALKIPCVSCSAGQNNTLDFDGNLNFFKKIWIPIINYAAEKSVKIAIENCPGKGKYAMTGSNLMFCPGIWKEIFAITPENFGLNLDPSHIHWQMVDPVVVVEEFASRIFHVHAKDTKINKLIRDFEGVFGHGIYHFTIPGRGEIDWKAFLQALNDNGYKGVVSIEHEDGEYSGTDAKVKEGLLLGKQHLLSCWPK